MIWWSGSLPKTPRLRTPKYRRGAENKSLAFNPGHVEEKTSEEKSLFNVYPNPFSSVTNIEFNLGKAADVQLSVYNLFGQQVKVLVNNELPEGKHKIRWNGTQDNGSAATNGIYLCRFIKDGEVSNVKRLILNR